MSSLIPIWIFGGTALAMIVLNVVTAGGTTTGAGIDSQRLDRRPLDPATPRDFR